MAAIAYIQVVCEYPHTTTTVTHSHTTRNGANRLLLVKLLSRNIGTWTAPTYNGVSLTPVIGGQVGISSGSARRAVSVYYLENPPIGTYDLVLQSSLADSAGAVVENWVNVDNASGPFRDQSGGNQCVSTAAIQTNSSISVTSTNTDAVTEAICSASTPTASASQTVSSTYIGRSAYKDGATTSTTMSWTFPVDECAHVVMSIIGLSATQPPIVDYTGPRGKKSWNGQGFLAIPETMSAGVTNYISLAPTVEGGIGGLNESWVVVPGTFSNPAINVTANTATTSVVVVLIENNVDTGVTITVPAGAGNIGWISGTGTHTLSGTNKVGWKIIGAASGSITVSGLSIVFTPTGSVTQTLLGVHNSSSLKLVSGTTRYIPVYGTRVANTTELPVTFRMPFDATWMYSEVTKVGTTSTSLVDFNSRINFTNGTQVLQWPPSTGDVKVDTTHIDTLSEGDEINYVLSSGAGTGDFEIERFSSVILNNNSEFLLLSANNGTGGNIGTGTVYSSPVGQFSVSATQSLAQFVVPFDMVAKRMFVQIGENTGSQQIKVTLMINGVPGNQFIVAKSNFSDAYYADVWNIDTLSAGDLISYRIEFGGTSNTARIRYLGFVGIEVGSGGGPSIPTLTAGADQVAVTTARPYVLVVF